MSDEPYVPRMEGAEEMRERNAGAHEPPAKSNRRQQAQNHLDNLRNMYNSSDEIEEEDLYYKPEEVPNDVE